MLQEIGKKSLRSLILSSSFKIVMNQNTRYNAYLILQNMDTLYHDAHSQKKKKTDIDKHNHIYDI
jgi:hypothetical protein